MSPIHKLWSRLHKGPHKI